MDRRARGMTAGPGRLLLLGAVASAFAALTYEVVWVRQLSLLVGATWPALSTVLGAFMLGLGVGGVFGGAIADRVARPARAVIALELFVALTAPMLPAAWARLDPHLVGTVGPVPVDALVLGATLLPVTLALGANLPLLVRAAGVDAGAASRLYTANVGGALLGAVLGGLVGPYLVGVPATLGAAAAGNLLAAVLVAAARTGAVPAPGGDDGRAGDDRAGIGLAFGSGLLLVALEVLWSRVLLLGERGAWRLVAVDASEVGAVVIGSVVAGGGLGAWIVGRLPGAALGRVAAVAFGLGAALAVAGGEWAQAWISLALGAKGLTSGVGTVVCQAGALVPAAVGLGMAFPAAWRASLASSGARGRRAGRLLVSNAVGAVIGSTLAGWGLIPLAGASGSVRLLASAGAVGGGLAALRAGAPRWGLAVLGLAALPWAVPAAPGQVDRLTMGPDAILAAWEGAEATTWVAQEPGGTRTLASNGLHIRPGAGYRERGRQTAALHRAPGDVLVVGLGTGLLVAGLLEDPRVQRLTVVELDPNQAEVPSWFGAEGALRDPRLRLVIADAVPFVRDTADRFDLVVVDAWGPDLSQAVYAADFHHLLRARLAPGGLVWAKLPRLDPASDAAVVDAVRCTWPRAWREIGQNGLGALVGGVDGRPTVGLSPLAAGGACDPLTWDHPRRLRAGS